MITDPELLKEIEKRQKKKEKEHAKKIAYHQYTRKSWLKEHPEDIWIDEENQQARKRGYEDDDVRRLMSAICLQACIDYSKASHGHNVDFMSPAVALEELDKFFESPIFDYFINRIRVTDAKKAISMIPDGVLGGIWKRHEFAKNTTPIIEEQCEEQGS